jgi:hypothetical protein
MRKASSFASPPGVPKGCSGFTLSVVKFAFRECRESDRGDISSHFSLARSKVGRGLKGEFHSVFSLAYRIQNSRIIIPWTVHSCTDWPSPHSLCRKRHENFFARFTGQPRIVCSSGKSLTSPPPSLPQAVPKKVLFP